MWFHFHTCSNRLWRPSSAATDPNAPPNTFEPVSLVAFGSFLPRNECLPSPWFLGWWFQLLPSQWPSQSDAMFFSRLGFNMFQWSVKERKNFHHVATPHPPRQAPLQSLQSAACPGMSAPMWLFSCRKGIKVKLNTHPLDNKWNWLSIAKQVEEDRQNPCSCASCGH